MKENTEFLEKALGTKEEKDKFNIDKREWTSKDNNVVVLKMYKQNYILIIWDQKRKSIFICFCVLTRKNKFKKSNCPFIIF